MEARERWQALQARLTAAREAVDAGDRATALREISAALDLDKDYLAAQALRDQIVSMSHRGAPAAPVAPVQASRDTPVLPRLPIQDVPTATATPLSPSAVAPVAVAPAPASASAALAADLVYAPDLPLTPIPSPSEPPALPPGYAKFEQRAKRRRVDRRIDAARLALDQQRLKAAAVALDEVIELDPNLPELAELTARFDQLRRATATPHRGPWVAAAAVFVGALLAGSWLQDSSRILSRQTVTAAPLLEPLTPTVPVTEQLAAAATSSERDERELVDSRAPMPAPVALAMRVPDMPDAMPATPVLLPVPPLEVSPPARVAEAVHAAVEPINRAAAEPINRAAVDPINRAPTMSPMVPVEAVSPLAGPAAPTTVAPPDEGSLIRQALQRYRSAYEGLDAQSAQAVWPAVNQAALARAFDGLQSQSLTFEGCDLRVRGEAATATCHGSARYVTKIGNREPHVEPRVWNFTLHKAAGDWKIDSARAER
jgi:hypothetical protein